MALVEFTPLEEEDYLASPQERRDALRRLIRIGGYRDASFHDEFDESSVALECAVCREIHADLLRIVLVHSAGSDDRVACRACGRANWRRQLMRRSLFDGDGKVSVFKAHLWAASLIFLVTLVCALAKGS